MQQTQQPWPHQQHHQQQVQHQHPQLQQKQIQQQHQQRLKAQQKYLQIQQLWKLQRHISQMVGTIRLKKWSRNSGYNSIDTNFNKFNLTLRI